MMEVQGGVEEEIREFTWSIKNFATVLKDNSLVDSQGFEFQAGDAFGVPSKWRIYLQTNDTESNYRYFIGVYLKLLEKPASAKDFVFASCKFSIRDGAPAPDWMLGPYNMAARERAAGSGLPTFLPKRVVPARLVDGTLIIQVTFKLYSKPISSKPTGTVQELVEKFNKESSAKAWSDLEELLQLPIGYNEVKILCRDGKQFMARKEVLAARSPVFEAMLVRCNMKEKATEEVELPDISSQTFEVLLHFIYTGKLLPEWRELGVLVELTNAAAKYQLENLLAFFDQNLGSVADSGNVVELLVLANQLDLKVAEAELMQIVKREGLSSKEKLFQILSVETPPAAQRNEGLLGFIGSLFKSS